MRRLLLGLVLLALVVSPATAWAGEDDGGMGAAESVLDQGARLVRRGDYAAADRLYGGLADQAGPLAPRARLLQARTALADGRTADAEALLQQLFRESPGSNQETSALFSLEQVRRAAGDCRGALRALDAYQASLGGAADPLGPYTPLQRAQCASQLGDWTGELQAVQQALATDGGGPRLTRIEANERVAEASLALGRKQDALDAYNQNLALSGTRGYTAEMLFTTATIARALGQDALATDRFRGVVVDYPETARAPGALDALKAMGQAGVVSPYQAGRARAAAGEFLTAAGLFEQVDPASPEAGPAHLEHARALLRLGRSDEAARELAATAEGYSAEAGAALLQLGQAQERNGNYAAAEAAYRHMGQLAPERLPETLFHAGLARYLMGDLDGALGTWRQALASGGSMPTLLRAELLVWEAKALAQPAGGSTQASGATQVSGSAQAGGAVQARDVTQAGGLTQASGTTDANSAAQASGATPASALTEAGEALQQAATIAPDSYYGLRAQELLAQLASPTPGGSRPVSLGLSQAELDEQAAWLASLGTTPQQVAAEVAAEPELARADALLGAGLRTEASWEVDAVTRRYTQARDLAHLGALADWLVQRDLPHLALQVARAERDLAGLTTLPRALQKQVFPASWGDLAVEQAGRYGLDPLLLLALVRQESSFNPQARSGADARGLMQIVPATARAIAASLGRTADFSLRDLYRPSVSLEFGAWFLQRMLGDFQGQLVPALAAYNAGGGNASRWLGRWGDDPDVLVEEIPFAETQTYVRSVYTNYLEYRLLYGGG